jgi:inward rectifier potassium channel
MPSLQPEDAMDGIPPAAAPPELQDLGFGLKLPGRSTRLLNQDGTFNVEKRGIPRRYSLSFYHALINMSWGRFVSSVFAIYVLVNLVFSLLYLAIGPEHLVGHDGTTMVTDFPDAFFFSAQTLTTVGYGRISPRGVAAGTLSAIESLMGLMGFALATGLLYARFARPKARLMFSANALVSPYRGGSGLMFRLANALENPLIEVEVQVSVSLVEGGSGARRFQELSLERRQIHFFPLSWTVVHPLGPDSPLAGFGPDDFRNRDGEIIVLVKAFDDSFSQTTYTRHSYRLDEVVYGARFAYIFGKNDDGAVTIDLHRIGEHEPAPLG